MVAPDTNEEESKVLEESQNKTSSDEISHKRAREETAEDAEKDLPSKKVHLEKSSTEESSPMETDNAHANNGIEEKVDNNGDKVTSNDTEEKVDSNDDRVTSNDTEEKVENNDDKVTSNHSESNKTPDKKDVECPETDVVNATKSSVTGVNGFEEKSIEDTPGNETNTANVSDKESDKNDLSSEKSKDIKDQPIGDDESDKEIKKKKKRNEQSEIINGVELTVECASDEDSNEESETEKNPMPRPKTQIVREEPNDSEVDASSSEAEKSDSYKIIEAKSKDNKEDTPIKQAKKRGRPKKRRTPSKEVVSASESHSENDNDSSAGVKRMKKSPVLKNTPEVKRGRGRPRKTPVKQAKELLEDESEKKKETSSDEVEKQKDEKSNEAKGSEKAEDSEGESDEKSDNDSDESEDVKEGKRRKPSKRNIKKIENLKKFIRAAGIRVKCYTTLLKGCETDAAKAKRLTEFLHEHGVVGRPTLDKCNKIRIKNETMKEIQELDKSSIISETRSTRGRYAKKPQNETKEDTKRFSPDPKASELYKRIKSVADSDSE